MDEIGDRLRKLVFGLSKLFNLPLTTDQEVTGSTPVPRATFKQWLSGDSGTLKNTTIVLFLIYITISPIIPRSFYYLEFNFRP